MNQPDYDKYFRDYAAAYERSLGATVDVQAIRAFFAESFIAASTDGQIRPGANDDALADALQRSDVFYKSIGTIGMKVDRVEADCLCENHDKVRVFYKAQHRKKDRTTLDIRFDLLYLLQRRAGGPKIFAFIAGDEMGLYRRAGLIDDKGQPA